MKKLAGLPILTRTQLNHVPKAAWLVDEILPAEALCVLFGPSGCGKSFVSLAWALSIANGTPWLGHDTRAPESHVLYIAAEGLGGMLKRVRAWEAEFNQGREVDRLLVLPQALFLTDTKTVGRFVAELSEMLGIASISLVVIDTLARSMPNGDENSTKDMASVVHALDYIRRVLRCAVLIVHHTGNAALERERGSSVLRAAADASFSLSADGTDLACAKQKDFEAVKPMRLQRREVALPDGEKSCVVDDGSPRSLVSLPERPQQAIRILVDRFGSQGATFSEWLAAAEKEKFAKSTFKNALGQLREGKFVELHGRYYVPVPAALVACGRIDLIGTGAEVAPVRANGQSRAHVGPIGQSESEFEGQEANPFIEVGSVGPTPSV